MAAPSEKPDIDEASAAALVQAAVEEFIDKHGLGEAPDLGTWVQAYPESLRAQIFQRCRGFLAFDGFLGQQSWEPEALAEPSARQFGDFAIKEELGRGGMGIVYLAHQRSLNRQVALKVMQSGLTLSKRHVERFRREAAAAAQLCHPGIVAVHSFTEVDGTIAFAMDYIAGRNLGDVLDDLRLRNASSEKSQGPAAVEGSLGIQPEKGYVAECAMLCAQLAAALGAAHQAGIAHRDLKPRNVMIDDKQQARLLDFGLAKSLGGESISMSGEITGTAHYMSPEQTLAKRVPLDHRTDVFSLGVILYELLTLKRPFDGKNLQQIVYAICFQEPAPIQKLNPKVPRDLVTVCMKALEKDPQNRYQTAAEFEADLQRFLRWEPVHARPAGLIGRLSKWVHRHRTETIAVGVVAAIGFAALGVAWYRAADARARGDELMRRAADADARGDHGIAIQLATEALALLPADSIQAKVDLYRQKEITEATQQARDRAESNKLALLSAQTTEQDRDLGLLLAREAFRLHQGLESRSAVLHALGSGYATLLLEGRPKAALYRARFDPSGRIVATCGLDMRAVLWDAATGQQVLVLPHDHWVVDVAFQPEGDLVATACVDGKARLWHKGTGSLVRPLPHAGPVGTVAFDRSGRHLLTTDGGIASPEDRKRVRDVVAIVWDLAGDEPRRAAELPDHRQSVELAVLSGDGRYAVTGDAQSARLWAVETRTVLTEVRAGRVAAFSPDDRSVAIGDEHGGISICALPDGQVAHTLHQSGRIHALAFGGDRLLLSSSADRTARIYQLDGGLPPREIRVLTGHRGAVLSASFDPSGTTVVTGCDDHQARVFDVATGDQLAHLEVGNPVKDARFDSDGRRVVILRKERAIVWDRADTHGTVTLRGSRGSYVRTPCFTNDGRRVVTTTHEGVSVWTTSGELKLRIDVPGDAVTGAALDPTSERIALGTEKGAVAIHGLGDGKRILEFEGHEGRITAIAFSADGDHVLTTSGNVAIVWNANDCTKELVKRRPQHIVWAALDGSGRLIATVEADGTAPGAGRIDAEKWARLWHVAGGDSAGTSVEHDGPVSSCVFRPDGTALLTTSGDRTARVTTLARHDVGVVTGPPGPVLRSDRPLLRAAYSADGTRVITCGSSADHVACLWDAGTGEALLHYRGHLGVIEGCAFGPGGALAVTASRDGTAQIWPTDPVGVADSLATLRKLTAEERNSFGLPPAPPGDR